MSFCRGILFVGGFWRSRALLAVSWFGGLFYGGMSFFAVDCALCAWFRWFTSFVCHFIVVWRSPALRLLCAAVSALCPVVFDGVLHFCADRCFSCCFPTLCVFSIVACLFFALFAEFCVFFLMFLFVVGLFFFAPIFLHC